MSQITLEWCEQNGIVVSERLSAPDNIRALGFIIREYIEQGAALFGRETSYSLKDFRDFVGGTLATFSDEETISALEFTIQKIRNRRTLESLKAGRFAQAEFVTIGDDRSCDFCRSMHHRRFAVRLPSILPPFHPRCRCRIQGV